MPNLDFAEDFLFLLYRQNIRKLS